MPVLVRWCPFLVFVRLPHYRLTVAIATGRLSSPWPTVRRFRSSYIASASRVVMARTGWVPKRARRDSTRACSFRRRSGGELTRIRVPGALQTIAFGINDRGDIVGAFTSDGASFHGFLLTQGRFITIDVPGASSTNALSINNAGEIAGTSEGTAERGFLLSQGRFVTIAIPDASATQATGINDRGQVIGTFIDSHGQHGFSGHRSKIQHF